MSGNYRQFKPAVKTTVKTVMLQIGDAFPDRVLSYMEQYRNLDSVHTAIVKTKIREILNHLEGETDHIAPSLVLLRYLSTEELEWDHYEYTYRFALFSNERIKSCFQLIASWDHVIGKEENWNLLRFFELSDHEVIQLCEFRREPLQLIWSWEGWDAIVHAELLGYALREMENSVVELAARFMEFLLGNLSSDSEMKKYSMLFTARDSIESKVSFLEKVHILRDYLLSEISLYAETRTAFRQL